MAKRKGRGPTPLAHLRNVLRGLKKRGATNVQLNAIERFVRRNYDGGGFCHYCSAALDPRTFSIDHADPVSRGGSHSTYNLRMCCLRCNKIKGSFTEAEFVKLRSCALDLGGECFKQLNSRLLASNNIFRRW